VRRVAVDLQEHVADAQRRALAAGDDDFNLFHTGHPGGDARRCRRISRAAGRRRFCLAWRGRTGAYSVPHASHRSEATNRAGAVGALDDRGRAEDVHRAAAAARYGTTSSPLA
jgi:hypothetical protein